MLSVFGDESTDSQKARVFAVAGLLGNEHEWADLRKKWTERLGGRVFHAADCESGYGEFRDMPEPDRWQLHADLTKIIADSRIMGYGSAIDLAGVRQLASSALKRFPDMPYYDCFMRTIVYLSDLAAIFVPRDRVEFTFDQHSNTQYNAGLLYDWVSRYRPVMVEKVSFATRKDPGIQAADLWARELMKRCDTHLFNKRAMPRQQWRSLISTHRFSFKLLRGQRFAEAIDKAGEIAGLNRDDYEKWRYKNSLVDNLSNRFRYLAVLHLARHDDEKS